MAADEEKLPLAVETVEIARRRVPTGQVRVHVIPEDREEHVEVSLQDEDVAIERVPVGQYVDAMPPVRNEGNVTVIPVVEERPVVTIRLFLREEVRLRHDRRTRVERHAVTLRSERVEVERQDITEGDLRS